MISVHGRIIEIWSEVLGAPVREDSDFFELGGHSLLGVRITVAVEEEFGVRVSLQTLFDNPTPAEFARAVEVAVI